MIANANEASDRNEVANGVKELIAAMMAAKRLKYKDISEVSGVSVDSIKQFMTTKRIRVNSTNKTYSNLLKYIYKHKEDFEEHCSIEYARNRIIFAPYEKIDENEIRKYQELVIKSYQQIYRMLKIKDSSLKENCERLQGRYKCYRYSESKENLIRSEIIVKEKLKNSNIWEYEHTKSGFMKELIRSDGPVLSIDRGIYLIGDIENGGGIEVFHLKAPLSNTFSVVVGLVLTLTYTNEPIAAKVVLHKCDEGEDEIPKTIDANDLSDSEITITEKLLLRNNLSHGVVLANHI